MFLISSSSSSKHERFEIRHFYVGGGINSFVYSISSVPILLRKVCAAFSANTREFFAVSSFIGGYIFPAFSIQLDNVHEEHHRYHVYRRKYSFVGLNIHFPKDRSFLLLLLIASEITCSISFFFAWSSLFDCFISSFNAGRKCWI